jgi:LacI family transcriptional regulator
MSEAVSDMDPAAMARSADPPRGISSRDVARVAGLSQSTVSRVINGHPNVAPELRLRVERAMEELGYVPNAAARSLITRRSDVIGLLISNITNAFFAELVDGATAQALATGFSVMLGVVPVRARGTAGLQDTSVRALVEKQVDGIILTSALEGDAQIVRWLVARGVPVVGVRPPSESTSDTVSVDHRAGSRMATAHLIEHRRDRIAFLGGRPDSLAAAEHLAGHMDALERAGRASEPDLIMTGEFTYESAYRATVALIESERRFDAVVAPADIMALGCLDALADNGIDVPGNVAVAGFDDIPAAGLRGVGLTTVRAFPAILGANAVDLLLDRITGRHRGPARHIVITPELIVRRSCGDHPTT